MRKGAIHIAAPTADLGKENNEEKLMTFKGYDGMKLSVCLEPGRRTQFKGSFSA